MRKLGLFVFVFFMLSNIVSAQVVGKMENDTLVNYLDINNKKQGKWIKKYDNGNTWYIGNFVNDAPIGEFTRYHKNGKLMAKMNYAENGSADAILYDDKGIKIAEGAYNSNRQRNGLWRIYYNNGNVAMILNYTDGKVEGSMTMYYPESEFKVLDINYKDGKLEGDYKKYFKGNRLQEEGPCEKGVRHGHWKLYNPDGFLTEEGMYINGKKEGEWKYYELGEFKKTISYTDDRADNFEEIAKEWDEKLEWAKKNQDKFKNPEDYFDNPIEFFRDDK